LNGSTQSVGITVTSGTAIASLTVSAPTVVGGNPVFGTVTLTAAAPAGGAIVALTASDPATVSPTVTVAAGDVSAPFTIGTRAVGGTMSATINGSYGGGTASATISVTPPTTATANFGVTGPSESDTCTMSN